MTDSDLTKAELCTTIIEYVQRFFCLSESLKSPAKNDGVICRRRPLVEERTSLASPARLTAPSSPRGKVFGRGAETLAPDVWASRTSSSSSLSWFKVRVRVYDVLDDDGAVRREVSGDDMCVSMSSLFHGKFYHRSIGVSVCVSTFHRPNVRRADLARDLSRCLVLRLRETEAGQKNKAPRPRRVPAASSRGLATVRARRLIASAAAEA